MDTSSRPQVIVWLLVLLVVLLLLPLLSMMGMMGMMGMGGMMSAWGLLWMMLFAAVVIALIVFAIRGAWR